jgi:hypothetical protein
MLGKLMGHKSVQTTARYANLADDPLRLASSQVGGVIADAMKGGGRPRKAKWVNATKTKPNLTPKQWKTLKIEFPRLSDDIFVGRQSLRVRREWGKPSSRIMN